MLEIADDGRDLGRVAQHMRHLSYSSVRLFQTCGASWDLGYNRRLRSPLNATMRLGTACHRVIQAAVNLQHHGYDYDLEALWEDEWPRFRDDRHVVWGQDLPMQFGDMGEKLVTHDDTRRAIDRMHPYVYGGDPSEYDPLSDPFHFAGTTMIEHPVRLVYPGVGLPIIGFIDLLDSACIPWDIKTASRSWTVETAMAETQPLFYLDWTDQEGLAVFNPERVFRHLVLVKNRDPKIQIVETRRSDAEIAWMRRTVAQIWRAMHAGVYVPNTTAWFCSPDKCHHWDYCRGNTKPVPEPPPLVRNELDLAFDREGD